MIVDTKVLCAAIKTLRGVATNWSSTTMFLAVQDGRLRLRYKGTSASAYVPISGQEKHEKLGEYELGSHKKFVKALEQFRGYSATMTVVAPTGTQATRNKADAPGVLLLRAVNNVSLRTELHKLWPTDELLTPSVLGDLKFTLQGKELAQLAKVAQLATEKNDRPMLERVYLLPEHNFMYAIDGYVLYASRYDKDLLSVANKSAYGIERHVMLWLAKQPNAAAATVGCYTKGICYNAADGSAVVVFGEQPERVFPIDKLYAVYQPLNPEHKINLSLPLLRDALKQVVAQKCFMVTLAVFQDGNGNYYVHIAADYKGCIVTTTYFDPHMQSEYAFQFNPQLLLKCLNAIDLNSAQTYNAAINRPITFLAADGSYTMAMPMNGISGGGSITNLIDIVRKEVGNG